jgi:hypothetical protein
MNNGQRSSVLKELPIERIFRKVVGRKMTPAERLCFRLKLPAKPAAPHPRHAN